MSNPADIRLTSVELKHGAWLFAKQCEFVAGAADAKAIPPMTLPEVAFAGRSNVGKSSLINALVGHNALARVSQTPGCTRQLNFFDLGQRLLLCDMPGYGYAKASKTDMLGWSKLIFYYLRGRANLRRVFVLIDGRHGIKEADEKVMEVMDDAAVTYQVVLTKTDKVSEADLNAHRDKILSIQRKHVALHPVVMLTSSREKQGIDELRAEIATFVQR